MRRTTVTVLLFAPTVFLSAFLLFQVQPLIGRFILPWFGGTNSVWTTCMLFFQAALFAGYAYAHGLSGKLTPRGQWIVHAGLLASAVLLLPIAPSTDWKPSGGEDPALRIVLLLTACVGLPFFVLSSTGPLLQRWFSRAEPGTSPYRLYALSNAGSLLALVSYPLLFERVLPVSEQATLWSWSFAAFAILCFASGWLMWSRERGGAAVARCGRSPDRATSADRGFPAASGDLRSAVSAGSGDPRRAPAWPVRLMWFSLAMTASVMLLATTNQLCIDVASVPFLWVLPLTIYLLSFILCFESDRWYSRKVYAWALAVSMAGVTLEMLEGAGGSIVAQSAVYMAGLFFCCMVCHGELVRLKPSPLHLTAFYLVIAAGGAAGGLFVGLVAPLVFPGYLELHVGIVASCGLLLLVVRRDASWFRSILRRRWAWPAMLLALLALTAVLHVQVRAELDDSVAVSRNFYGVLRVFEREPERPELRRLELFHGHILHGLQFTAGDKRREPTAYFGRTSGIGLALTHYRPGHHKRVGIIGLGVGALAAYAEGGDVYRFYEIDPQVVTFANRYFTYLSSCRGRVDVVLGDARLSLERETGPRYDVLVLDAFSGDAIPVHLLTREAFRTYVERLKPDGLLAAHISNLYFDLRPVVRAAADHFGLNCVTIIARGDESAGTRDSLWMLLSRDPQALAAEVIQNAAARPTPRRIVWTDDRSNLLEVLW